MLPDAMPFEIAEMFAAFLDEMELDIERNEALPDELRLARFAQLADLYRGRLISRCRGRFDEIALTALAGGDPVRALRCEAWALRDFSDLLSLRIASKHRGDEP